MTVLASVLGVVVLALALWWRTGRSDAARWWRGSAVQTSVALVLAPGLGLLLLGVWPLSLAGAGRPALYAFVPVVLLGLGLGAWSALQLRTPRWLLPAWARTGRAARR